MYSAYSAKLIDFLAAEPAALIGQLHHAIASEGFSRQWTSQTSAWREEVAVLQRVARDLIAFVPKSRSWTILLEYEIARRGRRIDAVLLLDKAIVVIEFKASVDRIDGASQWQVREYAMDLRDFHSASGAVPIIPMLVAIEMTSTVTREIVGSAASFNTNVQGVISCSPDRLTTVIAQLNEAVPAEGITLLDHDAWCKAPYRPSLNIIEAAEQVFAGHQVREISHITATNLTNTVDAVVRAIQAAHRNQKHVVCLVTGVPGAGKTLAGLSAVHDPALRADGKPAAVFLSGNGPLVNIVRAALLRDLKRRGKKTKESEREVSTFIQNVHSFLNYYAFKATADVPSEHVIVFDEAQRAWDGERMAFKGRGSQSEAKLILEVMARCPGWSVIVALVGFGQEIHRGEAGLQEWGRAIRKSAPSWNVVASPSIMSDDGSEDSVCLFNGSSPAEVSVEIDPALHLAVSIRSTRARMVSQWVAALLEGNADGAATHFSANAEFPVVLTRELDAARKWLFSRASEIRNPGACGLLASSGALRLRAYGIEVSSAFRRGYPYEDWFLGGSGEVRSSSMLEVAATEFECQGLELDWAGLCWAGDLTFDSHPGSWVARRFVGSRWQLVSKPAARQFILNKYRVLLTRARKGLVVWVPPGSTSDRTLDCSWMDSTAEFLMKCGVPALR